MNEHIESLSFMVQKGNRDAIKSKEKVTTVDLENFGVKKISYG